MNTQRESRPLLEYDGKTGELYGIFLKNLLLSLVTLGIYRFWATTNLRRYVWSRMRFQRERFEYTGTGGELFKGFLLALAIVVGSVIGAMVLSRVIVGITGSTALGLIPIIALYLGIAILGAGAYFSAQRYRMSRTVWRGIRGGMSGSALQYGARALFYGVLCIVSLYQLLPWMSIRLAERRINATSFGNETFRFSGSAGKLYGAFVLCFVGCIALVVVLAVLFVPLSFNEEMSGGFPPLGVSTEGLRQLVLSAFAFYLLLVVGAWLISCYYFAQMARHVAANTTFGALRFESRLTGAALFRLMLGNLAITILTLGFGYPFALQRSLRVVAATLFVHGEIDPDTLHQNGERVPATGEGMLNLLDGGEVSL
jgi:uncharacterized membrane protein YjgN (DUF898 family)